VYILQRRGERGVLLGNEGVMGNEKKKERVVSLTQEKTCGLSNGLLLSFPKRDSSRCGETRVYEALNSVFPA